ncbi:hypothetical protein LOZ53_006171 [Ophidiomyces ophidiicola]|uniref:Uncharacterized protein n=1 Tax=Ophidiomyces ophidiicola TaxID=1387563 RepID=A0ACB8UXK5_9EURO|nr:uncharacterized protein LOZ57_006483 [Ophidiomyces ophidiicola]KAI1909870.1 hypothetical protein LOZ61_004707 [Ophidiomyces ophidiicola]KAI1924100.1 hypothetical protein LOZ64_000842 [Ophidiomyces ophidiicola]KAI1925024.1 hypothetical protein LOZ60_004303 [Ophidiomyces ophidiicola]KAI1937934.1 hypothetical protein LOZ57_006483 [Ophidiomyces ophidiicola]KAI1972160.1 hypothetical protein LOZ55_005924 [Ophidiomyces ophidiicola]
MLLSRTLLVWLLPTAVVTAAPSTGSQGYVPRTLDDSIKALGLENVVKQFLSPKQKRQNPTRACTAVCNALRFSMPSDVYFPGSSPYSDSKNSYWAQQQSSVSPACFLAAKNTHSVAVALILSQVARCPFALRSGGHSDVPGASNSIQGVSIDLRAFNKISLSADKKVATIGTGAKWAEVFQQLDPHQVTVAGGRSSGVGVGGLTLGGGVSYISGYSGLACDSVLKFKVMMADGQILEVDQHSHPYLYFALRGGGNNFGVVLQFEFETYPVGQVWGGFRVYPVETTKDAINRGLTSYNENPPDRDFSIINGVLAHNGSFLATLIMSNAKPQTPSALELNFKDLLKFKPLRDTTRITTIRNLTLEVGQSTPSGFRQQFTTATYRNSAELQNYMVDIFMEEVKTIQGSISQPEGFLPAVAFQPVPKTVSSQFQKRGGNALGLSSSDGPLIVVNICFQWASAADDKPVLSAIRRLLDRTGEWASTRGLLHHFEYMNYAAPYQKPITSYGAENVRKLRRAQTMYDPRKVFEELQPGGFKLSM